MYVGCCEPWSENTDLSMNPTTAAKDTFSRRPQLTKKAELPKPELATAGALQAAPRAYPSRWGPTNHNRSSELVLSRGAEVNI